MDKMQEASISALDNKSSDLFAIYENLHESFLDLTFKNLAGPSATSNRHDHTKQARKPTLNENKAFSFPKLEDDVEEGNNERLREGAARINGEVKLNLVTTVRQREGRDNGQMKGELRINRGVKPNQVINNYEQEDVRGDEGLKRALSESRSAGKKMLVLGDVLGPAVLKSPSVVRATTHQRQQQHHLVGGAQLAAAGAGYNHGQAITSKGGTHDADVMTLMRTASRSKTPPRHRSHRCSSCNKFILFFRIRCSDCSMWFCTKCAKKYENEGHKCKGCSFERLRATRRGKEQQQKQVVSLVGKKTHN